MTETSRRRRPAEVPTLVRMQGPLADERAEAEAFVCEAFRIAYDARIEHFMPTLMALRNDAGRLLAVLGLREPGPAPLFLEQYLGDSIEQALGTAAAGPVDRGTLVEVGNFAVGAAGGGRWLITALTAYLFAAGRSWAVFTCGPELQNAFRRLGIGLVDLGVADPGRLAPGEHARWGRYYDQGPRVMAASVAQSHHVLSGLFERECALNALWLGALQAGRLAA
jgi:hypothetical protein